MLINPGTPDLAKATIDERLRVAERARLVRAARHTDTQPPRPGQTPHTDKAATPDARRRLTVVQLLLVMAVIALVMAGSVTTLVLETAPRLKF